MKDHDPPFPRPTGEACQVPPLPLGLSVLPLTDPIMERFARIRFDLRRAGNLIPDMDLLIATTAVTHGLTLMTRNVRHFQRIPDLALNRPS